MLIFKHNSCAPESADDHNHDNATVRPIKLNLGPTAALPSGTAEQAIDISFQVWEHAQKSKLFCQIKHVF